MATVPVKLIIAGSRTVYPAMEVIDAAVLALPIWGDLEPAAGRFGEVISLVISGRSPGGGADHAGEAWAATRGIPVHVERITEEDIKRYGTYRGPKMRNRRMAELGDVALCFWDAFSGGTADMVTRMVARHKLVEVVPTKPTRKPGKTQRRRRVTASPRPGG